jgi:hypothetical protein
MKKERDKIRALAERERGKRRSDLCDTRKGEKKTHSIGNVNTDRNWPKQS